MARLEFGEAAYNDPVKDNLGGSVHTIEFLGTGAFYNNNMNVYAQRSNIRITYDNAVPLSDIVPTNVPFYNDHTQIFTPERPERDLIRPRPHVWRINAEYNYESISYEEFVEDLDESELPSIYLQEESYNNKFIPGIDKLKNFSFETSQDKIQQFYLYGHSYNIPNASSIKHKFIFDYDHTFVEHSMAEEYPIYNEIYFSYQKPKVMIPFFKETAADSSSLFERIMMMCSLNSNSLNPSTNSGFKVISMGSIVNKYFEQFNEDDILFLSEDYYSHPSADWSHIFRLDNIIKNASLTKHFRNYQDILEGKKAPNEFLFFKIEKYLDELTQGQPIQTYIVPATKDFVSIIDTQIRHDEIYSYKVTGYCAVYGSAIHFHNLHHTPGMNTPAHGMGSIDTAEFIVDIYPDIKIVEINLFTHSARATKTAPLTPFVSFHNESNSSNKIKIYLEVQQGYREEVFIPITEDDNNQFASIEPVEFGIGEDSNIYRFGYTREPFSVEMYKTDVRPKSYFDFANQGADRFTNLGVVPNMMVYDYIPAEKKHYYTFRVFNSTGMVSNPSPVFEVELLKDAEGSKIIVDTVNFDDEKDLFLESINFRKMFQIFPADQQTNFRNLTDEDPKEIGLDNIQYGPELNSAWGRKFKIRVRSNDSGKVMDFNVKFNLVKRKSEEDFSV